MKPGSMRRGFWVLAVIALGLSVALRLQSPSMISGSLPPVTISGTAQVGGPFELMDQTGKRRSDKELLARGGIITFGWTRDPDMTPALLQMLSAALEKLGPAGTAPVAAFVSLDPEHDEPARLASYLKPFHPTLVGLTGPAAEINHLASAYKLYWKRIADGSLPGGYSIDFAALYYVMGPGGNFRGVVPYTTEVTELAEEIGILLRK